jgi:hypothetical protein
MNDAYYHPPKADDPGKKLSVLTAHNNPVDTSSFVAKDMGKDITVLTAKDGLLAGGFVLGAAWLWCERSSGEEGRNARPL